jgi:hypothetical protein
MMRCGADQVEDVADNTGSRIIGYDVALVIAVSISARRRRHITVITRRDRLNAVSSRNSLSTLEAGTVVAIAPVVCISTIVLSEPFAVLVVEVEIPRPVIPTSVIVLVATIIAVIILTILGKGTAPNRKSEYGNQCCPRKSVN